MIIIIMMTLLLLLLLLLPLLNLIYIAQFDTNGFLTAIFTSLGECSNIIVVVLSITLAVLRIIFTINGKLFKHHGCCIESAS